MNYKLKIILIFLGLLAVPIFISLVSKFEKPASPSLNATKIVYKSTESPTFILDTEKISFSVVPQAQAQISTNLKLSVSFNGKKTNIKPKVENAGSNKYNVTIAKSDQIQAGKYTLKAQFNNSKGAQTLQQNFDWGVLALNTPKSVYSPGERVDIAIAVLNEVGAMDCGAKLTLTIKDPSGNNYASSSDTGQITATTQCPKYTLSSEPDYKTYFTPNSAGKYTLGLTAVTKNGTYTISDSIKVENNVSFDVERITQTRTYPPLTYPVKLNITANQDFEGKVTETVPAIFNISKSATKGEMSFSNIKSQNLLKVITWKLKIKKGDKVTLGYNFKGPNISPYLFSFQPLAMTDNQGKVIFQEQRQWQIASDTAVASDLTNLGGSTLATAASGQRKIVRTTNGTSSKRVFALINNGDLELYYSDNPDVTTPNWVDAGQINASNTYTGDMVWDESNNVLYIAYGTLSPANSGDDIIYRRVSSLNSTPSIGAAQIVDNGVVGVASYSSAAIEIAGESSTNKVFVFANKGTAGGTPSSIVVRSGTINSDTPTFGTETTVKTVTGATFGLIGVARSNTSKLIVFYNSTSTVTTTIATRHDDSGVIGSWNSLGSSSDGLATTIGGTGTADSTDTYMAGSVVGTTTTDDVWFGWQQVTGLNLRTRRWNSSLGTELNLNLIGSPATHAGPTLTTDGTTVWAGYQWESQSRFLQLSSRPVTDGTSSWFIVGTTTTLELAPGSEAVQYVGVGKKTYQAHIDLVYTTGTTSDVRYISDPIPQTYSVTGTVFESDETTQIISPLCDNSTNVITVKDVTQGTSVSTFCSASTGFWTVNISATEGDSLYIYGTDASYKMNGVIVLGSSTSTSVSLYHNTVIFKDDEGAGMSYANIYEYDKTADPTNMLYTQNITDTLALTTDPGVKLILLDGSGLSFTAITDVITGGDLHVDDNVVFSANGNVDVGGNLIADSASQNSIAGNLYIRGGSVTMNASSLNAFGSTYIYNTGTISGSATFSANDLYLSGGGTTTLATQILLTDSLIVDGGHTLNGGTNSKSIILNEVDGATVPFVVNGSFIPGNSTVLYEDDGNTPNISIAPVNYYNLTMDPNGYIANMVFTSTGAINVYNDLSINPTDDGSGKSLTFNLGGKTVVNGNTSMSKGSTATAILSTTGTNYEFRTGGLTIGSGTTVQANGSNFYVSGNLTNNGTFTAGTSTVILNTESTQTLTGSGSPAITFNNLTIDGDSVATVKFTAGKTFVIGSSGTVSIPNGANINSTTSSQWFITHQGSTENIKAGNISNSGCTSSNTLTVTSGNNAGNNSACWDFGAVTPSNISTIKGNVTIKGTTTFK